MAFTYRRSWTRFIRGCWQDALGNELRGKPRNRGRDEGEGQELPSWSGLARGTDAPGRRIRQRGPA